MRLLIADHDRGRAKGLAEACAGRGHQVEVAPHGATALELALERIPEAVICPIDLAVIDGVRLAEILRGNPRTRGCSFVFLVHDELDAPISMDSRDATVVAPWHEADVLDHVDAILERSARFGEIRSDTEIEGKLSQISVADLLQIFQMNQKSGSVRIAQEGMPASATISIRGGQVVDAMIPLADGTAVVGEKALYRMLVWKEGRFEFIPGEVREQARISKPPRMLLMEGMRQKDEWDKLRRDLPGPEIRLQLKVPKDKIPAIQHPLTREVVEAVIAYRKIGEIVDHCPFPDYQVLRVVSDLFARDFLALEQIRTTPEGGFAESEAAIFSPPQIRRLREWASAQRPKAGAVLKLVVASAERSLVRAFVAALRETTNFVIDGRLAREPQRVGGLGALGHVPLGEGMALRLVGIPAGEEYAPLWDVAAHGTLGAVILPAGPYGQALEATEAIWNRLRARSPRAVHLLLPDAPGLSLSDSARGSLPHLEGGSFFVLPPPSSLERLDVLRSVFARLVP
jgi:CheY-like chemotaxis protein